MFSIIIIIINTLIIQINIIDLFCKLIDNN